MCNLTSFLFVNIMILSNSYIYETIIALISFIFYKEIKYCTASKLWIKANSELNFPYYWDEWQIEEQEICASLKCCALFFLHLKIKVTSEQLKQCICLSQCICLHTYVNLSFHVLTRRQYPSQ